MAVYKCSLRILDTGACVVKIQSQPGLHNESYLNKTTGALFEKLERNSTEVKT